MAQETRDQAVRAPDRRTLHIRPVAITPSQVAPAMPQTSSLEEVAVVDHILPNLWLEGMAMENIAILRPLVAAVVATLNPDAIIETTHIANLPMAAITALHQRLEWAIL